jgi:6-pyruvoyltetrahydropterin/6-carboxytetrahydropterin synthase
MTEEKKRKDKMTEEKKRKVSISRDFGFEAAHYVPNHKGACANLHGHSYEGLVVVSSVGLDDMGMVIDYGDLKVIIEEEIEDKYDHAMLNDHFGQPTAEVMVVDMFEKIEKRLSLSCLGIKLERVELKETKKSNAWVDADPS